ncbi:hypothetical protein EK904_003263, partial [Melospiza melodia maxima]
ENFADMIRENVNYLELFSSILQEVRQEQNSMMSFDWSWLK